jgi:hypothetical protein
MRRVELLRRFSQKKSFPILSGCDQQLRVGIPLLFTGGVAINSASQQQSIFV